MPALALWTDPMSTTDVVAARALRALAKVNAAINVMDKVTQQTIAMVEPSTAASHSLRRGAETLSESMSAFRAPQTPSRGHRPAPRAQAPVAALKSVGHRGSAAARQPAPCQGADEWEQF